MKTMKIFTLFCLMIAFSSCTENQRVKSWGATAEMELEAGKKLEMVTWKDKELWVLVSNREDSVKPKRYEFFEKSSLGVLEGKYIIIEK